MITEEERIHIKNTLALMNCMIKSGEEHSKQSNEMLTKSFSILLREAEPAQIAQKNEFVIPAVSNLVCDHYFAAYFDSNGKICYKDCEFCGEAKHTDC